VRYNLVHADFFALLAGGDDTLTMVGNQIDQAAYLDGGSGVNRLILGQNSARNLAAVNFV
jgi:hypothetical protein